MTNLVGASLNAGDNLAVPGDTTGERCAAQHREGPPCDFIHRSCLDVQLVVTRRTFVALGGPTAIAGRGPRVATAYPI
jgi:hypothetical protein